MLALGSRPKAVRVTPSPPPFDARTRNQAADNAAGDETVSKRVEDPMELSNVLIFQQKFRRVGEFNPIRAANSRNPMELHLEPVPCARHCAPLG